MGRESAINPLSLTSSNVPRHPRISSVIYAHHATLTASHGVRFSNYSFPNWPLGVSVVTPGDPSRCYSTGHGWPWPTSAVQVRLTGRRVRCNRPIASRSRDDKQEPPVFRHHGPDGSREEREEPTLSKASSNMLTAGAAAPTVKSPAPAVE